MTKEKTQGSGRYPSCFIEQAESIFAIGSSAICIFLVFMFFILTWIFGFDDGGAFGKACLYPDEVFKLNTFGTFGRIWAFGAVIVGVNILGIILSVSLYVWLKVEDTNTLITTQVII